MLQSQYRRTGYLLNDDRASGGVLTEADVTTCAHCQRIVHRDTWAFRGGWCTRCAAPICHPCGDLARREGCTPFARHIERVMEQQYRRQQNARVLGI